MEDMWNPDTMCMPTTPQRHQKNRKCAEKRNRQGVGIVHRHRRPTFGIKIRYYALSHFMPNSM